METLSTVERSYLWRVHLGLYLAHNPTLSRDQQNKVIEMMKLGTPPNLFGGTQDSDALRKYSDLSELSKADRKVSFSLMSAEDKSSVWRVQFGLYLARHPEWTEQQRAIVLEAITMVSPELYKIPRDSNWTRRVDEPLRLLTQKALFVFTKQEGAALFSELGPTEQPKLNHAQRTPRGCECSQESDWCGQYQCITTECTVLIYGCGTVGIYACNGKCYAPPNGD
jgi:hypothetical protein